MTNNQEEVESADHNEKNQETKSAEKEEMPIPKLITILDTELEKLKGESQENKDKYLRLLADQENMRKRLQKEREQLTQYAIQNVIVDFLGPIDHFENALKYTEQMSDEVKVWGHGFHMILNQFRDALSNQGVHAVASIGKPFDPHIHEAIETVETEDYPPNTVVEESVKGYKMGDKTIRSARVTVSKAPTI